MPWSRDLGGPKASIELAEELVSRGHLVHKYDIDDALPSRGRFTSYFSMALFARRATAYVRRCSCEYDVVQAEQGNLPVRREYLNFNGVLAARSSGLAHHHAQNEVRLKDHKNRVLEKGRVPGRILRWVAKKAWGLAEVNRSFLAADLIIVINRDELSYVQDQLGYREKALFLPNGMHQRRLESLQRAALSSQERQERERFVFIGCWAASKGAGDLPEIVRSIRAARPRASFRFLGTGRSACRILSEFAEEDRSAIEVVPSFSSDDLPTLVRDCCVGIFPSYMEGFGIAVLEKLGAKIPVVAYDVPGPREMLRGLSDPMMVPVGDTVEFASRALAILELEPAAYNMLADRVGTVPEEFSWARIADEYERRLYKSLEQRRQVSGVNHCR